jgi:hypothetical protein
MMQCLELFVNGSQNSINVLKYLDRNITSIRGLGVRLDIKKLEDDPDAVEYLQNKGVVRLPAVINADGQSAVGYRAIIQLFQNNLEQGEVAGMRGRNGTKSSVRGRSDDVRSYWESVMGEADNEEQDEDDEFGETASRDIQRRMQDWESRRPAHHTAATKSRQQSERKESRGRRRERRRKDSDEESESEEEVQTPRARKSNARNRTDEGGDIFEQKMMQAINEDLGDEI